MSDRKRIYIAGPISKGPLARNVDQATEAFVELARLGFAPFCPHWSVYSKPTTLVKALADEELTVACIATRSGNDRMRHAEWLAIDLPWVAASDAVLRLPGESTGADRETAHAKERGIPVFDSITELVAHFKGA